jgi:hypothetical protein
MPTSAIVLKWVLLLQQCGKLRSGVDHLTARIAQAEKGPLVVMGEIIDKPAVGGNLGVFVGDGQGAGQPTVGVVLGGGCPGVGGDVEGTAGAASGAAS